MDAETALNPTAPISPLNPPLKSVARQLLSTLTRFGVNDQEAFKIIMQELITAWKQKHPVQRGVLLKVSGITHHEGSNDAEVGDAIILIPDPTNPYDSTAIKVVLTRTGKQAGWIKREETNRVHGSTQHNWAGKVYRATKVSGGRALLIDVIL